MRPSIWWLWIALGSVALALLLIEGGVAPRAAIAVSVVVWLVLWIGIPLARRLLRSRP